MFFEIFLGIYQYQIIGKNAVLENDSITRELLVKKFIWAQWDPIQQTLYYIHNRKRNRCLVEGEEESIEKTENKLTPTLSGLQFNDELPHETVVRNIIFSPHSFSFQDDYVSDEYSLKSPTSSNHFK